MNRPASLEEIPELAVNTRGPRAENIAVNGNLTSAIAAWGDFDFEPVTATPDISEPATAIPGQSTTSTGSPASPRRLLSRDVTAVNIFDEQSIEESLDGGGPKGDGGLSPAAFLCMFALFILPGSDPRVPILRFRAALDSRAADGPAPGPPWWLRVTEFRVSARSGRFARGPAQACFAALAVVFAFSAAAAAAALPVSYEVRVAERCAARSERVMSKAAEALARALLRAFIAVSGVSVWALTVWVVGSMFGRGTVVFLRRYVGLIWMMRRQFSLLCVLSTALAIADGDWFFLYVAAMSVFYLPVFDLTSLIASRRWVSRTLSASLIVVAVVTFTRDVIETLDCSVREISGPLGGRVWWRLGLTCRLMLCFSLCHLLLRKFLDPRHPLAIRPWRPFLSELSRGEARGVCFEVLYGPHETRVVRVGGGIHAASFGEMEVAGRFGFVARRSRVVDAVLGASAILTGALNCAGGVLELVALVVSVDDDRQCFDPSSSGLAPALGALRLCLIAVGIVFIPVAASTLVQSIGKGQWGSVARFVGFIVRQHPFLVVSTIIASLAPVLSPFPPDNVPANYVTAAYIPFLDLLAIIAPRGSFVWHSFRTTIACSVCVRFIGFVLTGIRSSLRCDALHDPAGPLGIVVYEILSAMAAVWHFQMCIILAGKVREPSKPAIPFTSQPGTARDVVLERD